MDDIHLMFIYPGLASYTIPVLRGLAEHVSLDVFYSPWDPGRGFGDIRPFSHPSVTWHQVPTKRLLPTHVLGFYQPGLVSFMVARRPDAVLIFANPRYISFWAVLLAGRLLGIPVYPRGHGLYKKRRPSLVHRWMYRLIVFLSTKYICYTPIVQKSLLEIGVPARKLAVDYNTLYAEHTIPPEEKSGREKGILFLGRLRERSDIDVLIEAAKIVRKEREVELHIIGSGPLRNMVEEAVRQYPWIKYYGAVFDQERIAEISRACRIGCYPGAAGLSVVHYMALSLPVLTHNDLPAHMGPEPEYIQHGENGWLYERQEARQARIAVLAESIQHLFSLPPERMLQMQRAAFAMFVRLGIPPYHERLLAVLSSEQAI